MKMNTVTESNRCGQVRCVESDVKKLRQLVRMFCVVCIIILLGTQVGMVTFNAQDGIPELQSQQPQWSPGAGLYLNKHKYVAMDTHEGVRNFLSEELTGSPTIEQNIAESEARNFEKSGIIGRAEKGIVQGSGLPSLTELNSLIDGLQLAYYIKPAAADWWLSDTTKVDGYLLGRFIGSNGAMEPSGKTVNVERGNGQVCNTSALGGRGWVLSSRSNWPSPGYSGTPVPYHRVECAEGTRLNGTGIGVLYEGSSACLGASREDTLTDPSAITTVNVAQDRCVASGEEIPLGECIATYSNVSFKLLSGKLTAVGKGYANGLWVDAHNKETPCRGPITGNYALGIRPKITLNPQSLIIESIDVSKVTNADVRTRLKTYSQGNHEMIAGTDYKLRLFDATQNIQKVSKPVISQDDLFDVKDTTIQIEKGTTQVTLDATVNGTHNYISAMARDIDNNTTLYGKIGEHSGTGNTTSITLDLSNIMDTSKPGTTKQVNLYSEQINGEHESDLVSSKPLTVTFEVLEPRKEQKLSFDENNAREMMYGDTITLKANVNGADTTKGWAADTNPVFALVGESATSPVTLENPQFDAATGIATVTLKARNVDAAEVTLSLNKAGSDAQSVRYEKADEITTTIKINKRAITVTPKRTILAVGDTYPPPIWEFDTAMTDTSNKAKALVDGDVLPYTVKTSALESGQSAEPVLDQDNKITIANKAKKWGLSVSNGDTTQAAAVEAFEKKYDVKKNDYDGINNKKSRLEISSIRYDGIQFIKHPDDVTTLDEETFTFTAVATYPTKTIDDKDVPLDEQSITYQWQYSEDGKDWKDIPADDVGTHTADYKDGEATFTYTKTAEAADTKKQYRCTAKNKRDVEDGVTAMSNPAGLFVTMEPLTFIQIPQSVELVEDKNQEFAKNKTAYEANAIKLNEYKNTVSENKETTSQVPEGEFKIYVQTPFYLTLNKDEKQHDKKYQVTVTDANDKTLTTKLEADKYLLTSLSYKNNKKKDTFILKTPVDRKKTVGTYTGDMVFTIQYVKPSGGS